MKKIFFLLSITALTGHLYAQCDNCIEPLSVANGNFADWIAPSPTFYPTTCAIPLSPPASTLHTWPYITSAEIPNWKRINGTPFISSSFGMQFETFDLSGGHYCNTFGSEGLAAGYPFLAKGKYKINFNVRMNNLCSDPLNTSFSVFATTGLTEPSVVTDFVEPSPTLPAATVAMGNFFPDPNFAGDVSLSFCAPATFTQNLDQLYIKVDQDHIELNSWGRTLGLWSLISDVKVELCNDCPSQIYNVHAPSSVEPVTSSAFSAGGLFIDAGIDIQGSPFSNSPSINTMLIGRWITVNRAPIAGNAFTATADMGKFFLMTPNEHCANMQPCGPIMGESFVPCHTNVHLLAFPPGGTWTSSNTAIATVNSTGDVSAALSSPGGTVNITYTVGECVLVKTLQVENCEGRGVAGNEVVRTDNAAQQSELPASITPTASTANNATVKKSGNETPYDHIMVYADDSKNKAVTSNKVKHTNVRIEIQPNPATDNISIFYPCKQTGALDIAIKDVSGRVQHTENVLCNEGTNITHKVDISGLAPGVYFVELTQNDIREVRKIVKL